ncbi:DUF2271 domain-containing protein [Pseudomonas sp. AA-38]|uniref:DUF2271 domain-containing protein n=1 Tax=Pseudomonas sp. AA-38 TaxID=3028807 RepID=UPI0023F8852C|nr:DUF2271 domain-containing protein [Pseudomonas sp. AA-38]
MTRFLNTLAATCALVAVPALSQASSVTITTQMKGYDGEGAYLAIYLTDANGAYVRTLWVAGGKAKYYKHLSEWNRLSASDTSRLAGVTGASVGAGRSLKVTAELADALIDAGYELRIDAAVEDMRDSPSDVRIPLTRQEAGKAHRGKQYVQSLSYEIE